MGLLENARAQWPATMVAEPTNSSSRDAADIAKVATHALGCSGQLVKKAVYGR